MAKDKVKSHVRRTKKGVSRVAGHARKVVDRKGAKREETIKKSRKIGLLAAGGLATVGAIAGARHGLAKGRLKDQMMKMAADVNNLAKKHGKKATSVMNNSAKEVTSAVGAVPKLTQDQFNKAQKAAMSGGVNLDTMDIRSAPGVGLTQAQRGVAMVPVNTPAVSNKGMKTPIGKAGKKVVETGRATVDLGKQTRKAFNEGYANPGTGGAYQVGRNIFGGVKNTASTIDALVKRATKQRKTK